MTWNLKQLLKTKLNYILNFQPFNRIKILYTLTFDQFYLSLTLKRTAQSWFTSGLEKENSTNPEFATKNEYIIMAKLFQEGIHKE